MQLAHYSESVSAIRIEYPIIDPKEPELLKSKNEVKNAIRFGTGIVFLDPDSFERMNPDPQSTKK
jgi:hypothetical protein